MPETFVLGCSVAAKWLLPEPSDLHLAEFASLLAKRSRRKQISTSQAHGAFALMTKCAPRLFDTRPRLLAALDLSLHHGMSLWDCVYVALARGRDCPLLTADRRLFRAGGARHPSLQLLQ